MKQHITVEQLKELSLDSKTRLHNWFEKIKGTHWLTTTEIFVDDMFLPQLSIGEMIEFLAQGSRSYFLPGCSIGESEIEPETWCDELWEAVKNVLEGES